MDALASISPKMAASLTQIDNRPTDLRAAAEQFEALFIHQLLKQARSAKLADDILGSEAGDTYTEMLDQERAAFLCFYALIILFYRFEGKERLRRRPRGADASHVRSDTLCRA